MKTLVKIIVIVALFAPFIPITRWVLLRNDGKCKTHFGSEWEYRPTLTSGYCLNKTEGVRKYLD